MDAWDIFNWAGTAGFILCLVPQLVRTLKTRHADDISLAFLVLVIVSSVCVLAYMLKVGNFVFATAQAVNILVWGIVLAVRLGVGRRPASPGEVGAGKA